ncbi:replication initiator [Streptomyces antibioticus]|uniref:replication initiator n=1 Tax=Streptomyces antibioticus TaxID=1890 RepID=UPI00340037A7
MSAQLQFPCCTTVPARTRPSSAFTTPTGPANATDPASVGRSALERRARLTGRLAKLAATGHLTPLARQISTLGGCARPIRLTGQRTRDPLLGTPLDLERYDYAGAVLWNAHAPALWARFTTHLRREIAKAAGLTQRTLRHHATLSYAKVAEYQKRGQVHFHAVIRLDGPTGPTSEPPAWATTQLLDHAVRAAAARTHVHHEGQPRQSAESAPGSREAPRVGRLGFRFGRQIDVRPVRGTDFTGDAPVTDRHVAAYIAKYATKGAETTTGTLDRRLRLLAELAQYDITDHARRMIRNAWHLATRPQHAHLRLRHWAHMLGFRGHFSTRTRHYSTTLTHLRAERTTWRTRQADAAAPASVGPRAEQTAVGSNVSTGGQPVIDRHGNRDDRRDLTAGHRAGHCADTAGQRGSTDTILVISHWQYAGTGLLPELAHLADLLEARRPTRADGRRPSGPGHRGGHRPGHPGRQPSGTDRTGAVV